MAASPEIRFRIERSEQERFEKVARANDLQPPGERIMPVHGVSVIATDDPTINVERVSARVRAGGHDVPIERITTSRAARARRAGVNYFVRPH